MELSEPRRKRFCNLDSQPPLPIFIESEIGLSVDNWVPIVCTGVFNGCGVVVGAPAEISALHNMGNFGKGSNSRSRPYIMRNDSKIPQFIRSRQFAHRKKWKGNCLVDTGSLPQVSDITNLLQDINKLQEAFTQHEKSTHKEESEKLEVINVLSSDEEVGIPSTEIPPGECLQFSRASVIILPDSDSENDDYFENLRPKLECDVSNLRENLILTLQEAFFLAYGLGCLQILDRFEKSLDLDSVWRLFCLSQKDFSTKYIVYHYFRAKGWVVKPGVKFGGDYLLYKEGQPSHHASYIVIIDVIHDNTRAKQDWTSMLGLVRMAGTAVKEVMIAQVILPQASSTEKLSENVENIKTCSVEEILLRRWLSKYERVENDAF